MSDLEKIDIVLNEVQSVYGLTENTKNMLKDNIIKRASMYNGITPNINPEESSIIINPTSTVDVFLNRLVNNIRVYNLSNSYTPPNQLGNKGDYAGGSQTLGLESYNSIKDSVKYKFNNKGVSIPNEQLDICVRKVFNHEIGHALQHSFKGNDGMINNNYNIVVSNLAQKYPNMFQVPNKIPIQQINGGVKTKESNIYSKLDKQSTLLDEIFNESEALEISNMKNSQFEYNMKHGNKKIYNYDSSNYKITSYGNMMKIIMGNEKTYRAMYEDSDIIYKFFDQFKDISKEVFKTNDTTTPMQAVLIGLDEVRNKSNMDVANDLDLFFTKCLEKRVYHDLKNPNISNDELNRINNYIENFQNQMIRSSSNSLQQEIIINYLKELTKKRSNELNNENHVVNSEPKIDINKNKTKENLNDYRYCLTQIENIMNLRKQGNTFTENEKKEMTGRIFYYEGYLVKNIKTREDFEMAVKEVVSKFNGDNFERKIQLNILQDLQGKYKKTINVELKPEKTQLEQFLGELRKEVNSIRQEYRNMFFTEYTTEEQDILIERISNINNNLYSVRDLASNNKELKMINELTELINRELLKMNTIKKRTEEIVHSLGR